jgi:putative heme-binding domain-containing protein
VAADSPSKIVLKVQGGMLESISKDDVEQVAVSSNSLMPEGLEKQVSPQELADLFAYLALESPPGTNPSPRKIPGAP